MDNRGRKIISEQAMVTVLCIAAWWTFWFALRRINRPYSFLWYSVLICVIIWSAIYSWKAYDYRIHPYKEVVQQASVYLGPDIHYLKSGTIEMGQRVKLMCARGTWCKIKNNEICGWVCADNLR